MNRKFKIVKVEVHGWSTSFTIKDLEHENTKNGMSPEGLIHHIGRLFGKNLGELEGLEFEIVLPLETIPVPIYDPLDLCGHKIEKIE